jgi:hypothetical protein
MLTHILVLPPNLLHVDARVFSVVVLSQQPLAWSSSSQLLIFILIVEFILLYLIIIVAISFMLHEGINNGFL